MLRKRSLSKRCAVFTSSATRNGLTLGCIGSLLGGPFRLLQSQRRRRETTLDTVGEPEQPVFSFDEDELAEQWSAVPQIREALAQLPPRQRLALALRYVAGLTDRQIADVLGCRRGTACSLLSRGRTALQSSPLLAELRPNHL